MLQFLQATANDCTTLLNLMAAFYSHFNESFVANRTKPALLHLIATLSLGRVWLIKLDDALVGYCVVVHFFSLEYGGQIAILDELYVVPEQRGKQLGTHALAHVEAYARANAMAAVTLEVDHANVRARRLYERSGFTQVERSVMVKHI